MATVKARKKSKTKPKVKTKTKARPKKKVEKAVEVTITPSGAIKEKTVKPPPPPPVAVEEPRPGGPYQDLLGDAVAAKAKQQHRPQRSASAGKLSEEEPDLGGDEQHDDPPLESPDDPPEEKTEKKPEENPMDDPELRDMGIEATVECEIGFFCAMFGEEYESGHYGVDDRKILKSVWTYYFRVKGFPYMPPTMMLLIGHLAYIGQRTVGKEQRSKVKSAFGRLWGKMTRRKGKTADGEAEEIVKKEKETVIDNDTGKPVVNSGGNGKEVATTSGDPFVK